MVVTVEEEEGRKEGVLVISGAERESGLCFCAHGCDETNRSAQQ